MGQTYASDMGASAYRHLEAAEYLYRNTDRKDVAGYLYGIAAECALKKMMLNSGMRPLTEGKRGDDPFYAHFEELKTLLRDTVLGRRSSALLTFCSDNSFMQHWNITMRYSHGKDIESSWIDKWARDARDIIGAMDA